MAEEKKLKSATSVKKAKEVKEDNKPTYDQLKIFCDQLLMQRNQIAEKLQQVTDVINMLPWLFEVIKNKEHFDPEFVEFCTNSIKIILLPVKKEEKENKEDKK